MSSVRSSELNQVYLKLKQSHSTAQNDPMAAQANPPRTFDENGLIVPTKLLSTYPTVDRSKMSINKEILVLAKEGGGTIHFEAKRSDFKRTFDKIMTKKRDKAIADEKANQDFSHLLINARNHLVPASAKATGLPDASNKHVTSNKAAVVVDPVPVPVSSTPIISSSSHSSSSSSNMTKELEETLRKVKRKNGEANGDSHQATSS